MPRTVDVVVVGGGVAGCALAARLAGAGLAVTVLERETVYRDHVRGEGLVNWGYQDAVAMGLAEAVLGTPGASPITRLVNYDETWPASRARRAAKDLSTVLPGTPGIIGVGHPELRESLAGAAVKAGASVLRGVGRATATAGDRPSVSYSLDDGQVVDQPCRLVVVADGKNSATRRALGIDLSVTVPRVMLSGMAVDDGGAWDRAETVIGVEGRTLFYVIPRGGNQLRLYIGRLVDDPDRFTGPGRERRFLEAFRLESMPGSDLVADAAPSGPCASFPMTDSWTDTPVIPGVALVGDAAGWSNPVTGQGLAVALRDARVLADALTGTPGFTAAQAPRVLAPYAQERAERMRRLRFASALTDLFAAFGAPGRAGRRQAMFGLLRTRPELGQALAAVHEGPWSQPSTAFSPDILTALALA